MKFIKLILILIVGIQTVNAESQKVRIGVIAPLTGGASSNGTSIVNAIKLAQAKYDPEDKIDFLYEDDQLKPKLTVAAAKKLILLDQVSGLIVFGSPTSLAVSSIVEAYQVPMVAMSVVDRVVKGKKYVVKHWVTAEAENLALKNYLKSKTYQSIAIVSSINDAMLRLQELFELNDVNIVYKEEFNPEELDFKAAAIKIKSLNVAAVYNLLWAPQPGVFAKTLRQVGYQGDIFGAHNLEDPHEIKVASGTLEGAWYVTGDDHQGKDFYQLYKKVYGTLPANGGINAYDITKLVVEGIASGDLNNYLHTVQDFQGAYGSYGATGANDFTIPATIKKITKKGFNFVGY